MKQLLDAFDTYDLYQEDFDGVSISVIHDREAERGYVTLPSLATLLGYSTVTALLDSHAVQQQIDAYWRLLRRSPIKVFTRANHTGINKLFLFMDGWEKLKAPSHEANTQSDTKPSSLKPNLFANIRPDQSEQIWQKPDWSPDDQATLYWDALVWNDQQQDWVAQVETLASIGFDARSSEWWSSRYQQTVTWCRQHGKSEYMLSIDLPVMVEEVRQQKQTYPPYIALANF